MTENTKCITLEERYNYIINLKKALGINNDIEISKPGINDFVQSHNKNEVFLLTYIVKQMKKMPREVSERNECLIKAENSEEFKKAFQEIEILYSNHPVFVRYGKEISLELEFDLPESRHFFNCILYEICKDYFDYNTIFSEETPVLNLYLLQKWLNKNIYEARTTKSEEKIMKLLSDGYLEEDIISLNLIQGFNAEEIHYIINYSLPLKFNVDNIIQVLAIYLYKSF